MSDEYKITKDELCPFQIKQILLLKEKLSEIKQKNLKVFPYKLTITENEDNFIFKISDYNLEQQEQVDLPEDVKPVHLIIHLVILAEELNNYGIFLPILQFSQLLQRQSNSQSEFQYQDLRGTYLDNKINLEILLYKFGYEDLRNINIKDIQSISDELKDQLDDFQNIEFNEKMTVYALGYFMAQIKLNTFQNIELSQQEIFGGNFAYESFILTKLIIKCIEKDPNKRPSLKQMRTEVCKLQEVSNYTKDAMELQQIVVTKEILKNQSLIQLIKEQLQLKRQDLETGRIYLIQNLCKLKFIILYYENDKNKQDYFLLQELYNQFQEIEQLKKYQQPNKLPDHYQIPYDFHDSFDEILEFRQKYLKPYLNKILISLTSDILNRNRNKNSQIMIQEYYQQIQNDELKHLVKSNLQKVFRQIDLFINFPILRQKYQNYDFPYEEIYDQLLNLLFNGNDANLQKELTIQLKQRLNQHI